MDKQRKPKSKLDHIFENRAVQITFGLASLVLAYVFVSWALDSGSLLDYAIAILFLITGLRELIAGLRKRKQQ